MDALTTPPAACCTQGVGSACLRLRSMSLLMGDGANNKAECPKQPALPSESGIAA